MDDELSKQARSTAQATWPDWFRSLHHASATRYSMVSGRGNREQLLRARRFIDAHCGEPITGNQLASLACLSRFHFLRQFTKAFGATPNRYRSQARLRQAQRLLRVSDLSVTEVCLEVGFDSLGSFSTLFSRDTGYSPSQYRRAFAQVSANLIDPAEARRRAALVPFCFARPLANIKQ